MQGALTYNAKTNALCSSNTGAGEQNMGFAQLKKELTDKADSESKAVINEAKKKIAGIKKQVEEEAKKRESIADEETKLVIEMLEKREITSRRLDAKKMQFMAKKEMLEKAFFLAAAKIDKKLSEKDRKAFVEKLVKKAESEIEIGKITCNKKDRKYINKYNINEKDMLGGIIAENKDGTVIVDYSFESLLFEIKESELSHITNMLFK